MEEITKEPILKILKKIREIRKIKGFSHENMAFELNMSASSYNKLERSEIITKDKLHYQEEFPIPLLLAIFLLVFEKMISIFWWRQWA